MKPCTCLMPRSVYSPLEHMSHSPTAQFGHGTGSGRRTMPTTWSPTANPVGPGRPPAPATRGRGSAAPRRAVPSRRSPLRDLRIGPADADGQRLDDHRSQLGARLGDIVEPRRACGTGTTVTACMATVYCPISTCTGISFDGSPRRAIRTPAVHRDDAWWWLGREKFAIVSLSDDDDRMILRRRGPPARGPHRDRLAHVGALPERTPVGHREGGLQRQWRRLGVLQPRCGPVPPTAGARTAWAESPTTSNDSAWRSRFGTRRTRF